MTMFKGLPNQVPMSLFCKLVAILLVASRLGYHVLDVSVAAAIILMLLFNKAKRDYFSG